MIKEKQFINSRKIIQEKNEKKAKLYPEVFSALKSL